MKGCTTKFIFDYGNVTTSIFHVDAGAGHATHSHPFDHAVFVSRGSLRIKKEGYDKVHTPDDEPVNLRAKEPHSLEAMEDGTIFVNMFEKGKY
jgi:quercetin dioxygenase-like cupin family protein